MEESQNIKLAVDNSKGGSIEKLNIPMKEPEMEKEYITRYELDAKLDSIKTHIEAKIDVLNNSILDQIKEGRESRRHNDLLVWTIIAVFIAVMTLTSAWVINSFSSLDNRIQGLSDRMFSYTKDAHKNDKHADLAEQKKNT